MPVIHVEHYTREWVRSVAPALVVFGDNTAQLGRGGQASACRGEANAVGIVTKRLPSMKDSSFFTDDDMRLVWNLAKPQLNRLAAHLRAGGTVCVPTKGIGTGLAQLDTRAPRTFALLTRALHDLENIKPTRKLRNF